MKRIFMLVQRGMTDRTPVCVFPWEGPILAEIHGGNAVEVSIDELCNLQGAAKVRPIKLRHETSEPGKEMRAQFEAMAKIPPDENPLNDPEAEYGRLCERYGKHIDVDIFNVEKVFGSAGSFRRAMREYANGRVPEGLDVANSGPIVPGEKPMSEMTDAEIRAVLKEREIKVPKNADREVLEEIYSELATA